jgi:ABC-type multidrug transport system permease subunit
VVTTLDFGFASSIGNDLSLPRLIHSAHTVSSFTDLNSNGFCSSYTELRRFLTSVANHEIEHINGDRYILSGIRYITRGGHLIQEGSDNIR